MKRYIKLLIKIVKISWQHDTAYFANTALSQITPLFYVGSFLLFISVLYQNIDSIAGYQKQEILLLVMIGQLSYYSYSFWGQSPLKLVYQVNNGALDYLLTKPVSSLFMATTLSIKPLDAIINFLGPFTPAWLIIDWSQLDLHINNLPFAAVILLCGVILFHQTQFILSMIVFWTGNGKQASYLIYAASSQSIPLEGFSTSLKLIFTAVIPVYASSVVTSVILGKSSPVFWLAATLSVTLIFSIAKRALWRLALRQYSSASS